MQSKLRAGIKSCPHICTLIIEYWWLEWYNFPIKLRKEKGMIKTSKNPEHCPKCKSKNICLINKVYKKDSSGKKTNIPYLGMWICSDCGETIGRKMNEYENELEPDSI